MTTTNREFLLEDILAMLPSHKEHNWLNTVNDEGLFSLWKDLINLTLTENLDHV